VKKLAIIVFAVFVAVWLLASLSRTGATPSPTVTQDAAATEAFTNAVRSAVKASSKWRGIQVDEAGKSDYKLVLLYQDMPSSQREVERDTRAVMQAVLDTLVKQGRQPAQEHIFVTVRAHKPEKGATGQGVVRVFGRAVYDYNNDTIQYKAQK
jgi:hypothetical protein